jgi:hypothetical protein
MLGGFAYWYLWYLPGVTPSAPVPDQAKLVEHKQWATNGTDWYADWYTVAASPDELKAYYERYEAECSPTFRRYLEESQFMFSCTGHAKPVGVFHAEVGQEHNGAQTRTILIIEVAWDAD